MKETWDVSARKNILRDRKEKKSILTVKSWTVGCYIAELRMSFRTSAVKA